MSLNSPTFLSRQQVLFVHFQVIIPGHLMVKKLK